MSRIFFVLIAACLAANLVEGKWPWAHKKHKEPKLAAMDDTYDQINEELERNVASVDVGANMIFVEKLLKSSAGMKSEALDQLVALKSILTPDSCNKMGTEIVSNNNLATRGRAYVKNDHFVRRIDGLVHHYALQHSLICNQIYQQNCLDLLQDLGEHTFRSLLGLSVAYYHSGSDEKLDALVEEIKVKRVGEDFTTRLVIEENNECRIVDPEGFKWNPGLVYKYLKAAARNESGKNYLGERFGKLAPNADRVRDVFNQHVLGPCRRLLDVMKPDMDAYDYNLKIIPFQQQTAELGFLFLRAAVHSCAEMIKYPNDNREYVVAHAKEDL